MTQLSTNYSKLRLILNSNPFQALLASLLWPREGPASTSEPSGSSASLRLVAIAVGVELIKRTTIGPGRSKST